MNRYIVDYDILPQAIQKVIKVQDISEKTNISIDKICKEVGISKSTFYKYRNKIRIYKKSN